MMGLLLLALTLVISPLVLVQAEFPTDPCWVEDEACVIGSDNLLSSLSEVPDVATCRQLCDDKQDCRFFSHFGAALATAFIPARTARQRRFPVSLRVEFHWKVG